MKIVICTVPLRGNLSKTNYPPFGALAIVQSLRSIGYNPLFYDIDCVRPSFEEILGYLKNECPDIVGISAVVSTSYGYVKKLTSLIKEILPDSKVVVGGTLAVSAEILLKISKVDFCVVGEGEIIMNNLVKYLEQSDMVVSDEGLLAIKGICFLDKSGELIFNGYEVQIPPAELEDPDYSIIEKFSSINNYIIDPFFFPEFNKDVRVFEPKRKDKKLGSVVSAKGCVARCTFCHRWDKGIRVIPVNKVIVRIRYLMERYNVGFISFGDENFGANKEWIEELVEKIKPLDILYRIAGTRCNNVTPSLLKKLRESGCVSIQYGIESGSDKILRIMEKNVDVKTNIDVARWTHDAGLFTIYSMVLGMPGESPETVKETITFAKKVTEFLPETPERRTSINYLVVLPGSPVYEYARQKGLIGKTLEDEERYLLKVSDSGGGALNQLNLTDYSYFRVLGWRILIELSVVDNYYKKNNLPMVPFLKYCSMLSNKLFGKKDVHLFVSYNSLIYHLRHLRVLFFIFVCFKSLPAKEFLNICKDSIFKMLSKNTITEYIPLRDILKKSNIQPVTKSEINARILRKGR